MSFLLRARRAREARALTQLRLSAPCRGAPPPPPHPLLLCYASFHLAQAADGPSTSGQQQEQTAEQQQQQQPRAAEAVRARAAARRREQVTYRAAAVAASLGVSALAAGATYLRFSWLRAAAGAGAPLPWLDMAATLLLVAGGAIGMEAWARFAHRALWHDFQPGWALHKSHHEPRAGPFEVRAAGGCRGEACARGRQGGALCASEARRGRVSRGARALACPPVLMSRPSSSITRNISKPNHRLRTPHHTRPTTSLPS